MSANMVKHPYEVPKSSQYAPKNQQTQANGRGVVNYLNEGASIVREGRKEDAYKQMFKACDGEYIILGESNSETSPTYVSNSNGLGGITTSSFSSTYVYIHFECV
jgi:hypothetical protein